MISEQSVVTKVFISGCFDMLHAGHVEFFQRAAALGDQLYVALGSDRTVYDLKDRPPVNSEGLSRGALLHGAKRGLRAPGPDFGAVAIISTSHLNYVASKLKSR